MSDLNEWLKERRRIHELGNDVLLRNSYEIERETDLGIRDAKAVEDGFNNLPALLTAAEKVLELHQAVYLGTLRIKGEPDGIRYGCVSCNSHYPCPTVRAIEGEIK